MTSDRPRTIESGVVRKTLVCRFEGRDELFPVEWHSPVTVIDGSIIRHCDDSIECRPASGPVITETT